MILVCLKTRHNCAGWLSVHHQPAQDSRGEVLGQPRIATTCDVHSRGGQRRQRKNFQGQRSLTSSRKGAKKFGGLGRGAGIRSAYPTSPFGQEAVQSKIHRLPESVIDGCLRVAADAFLLTPFSVRCKHLRMLLALVWLQSYFHSQAVRIYGFGFRQACHQTIASASRAFPSTRTLRVSL